MSDTLPQIKPGLYKHFKGMIVNVIGISFDTETEKPYVVYIDFSKDSLGRTAGLWHRPLEMFLGEKEVNGKMIKRFEYIGE
jgi:hypothetical protein